MNRRQFLRTSLLSATGVAAAPAINLGRFDLFADDTRGFANGAPRISARAAELVGRSLVIDMLGLLTLDWPKLYSWFREPDGFGAADLQKLRATGVKVFHPAVETNGQEPRSAALDWVSGWNHLLHDHPGDLLRIDSVADFESVQKEGKLGLLVGFQNATHFQRVEDVALFHGLGQRISQLTYNGRNRLGSGCKEPGDGGLTAFGAQIVAAMNQAGMVVDVSHAGQRTALDAAAASKRPVLVTHATCRALVAHPRAVSDAVIRAVAERGGVVGITFIPAFVRGGGGASLEDVLDHFDHVARLVGIEHVGLGSDVDVDAIDPRTGRLRPLYVIRGLDHPRRVYALAEGLFRRGYNDREVELVLGGNFLRALAEIWGQPVPAALAPTPERVPKVPKIAKPRLPLS